jgi:hypothetical protein
MKRKSRGIPGPEKGTAVQGVGALNGGTIQEEACQLHVDRYISQSPATTVRRRIAERFGLTPPVAAVVAELAGLGGA